MGIPGEGEGGERRRTKKDNRRETFKPENFEDFQNFLKIEEAATSPRGPLSARGVSGAAAVGRGGGPQRGGGASGKAPEKDFDISSDLESSEEEGESDEKHKKKGWTARTKENIGQSAVGKALFNKFVDKETKKLIAALTLLVEKDTDKKNAKKVKSDIFRIAVKVIVLYEEKYVSQEDFGRLRGNFRRICSATRNGYRTGIIEAETAQRISEVIHHFANGIKEIIVKYVSASTMERIDRLVLYLGSSDFITRTSKFNEFDTIVYVLALYLQET
eukprot:TRINITY_DN5712_c0_g1_i2.p1 TRINITY_DN5712_c0_g1~~TRINITY_DN5712_c0_g1_i2.p1  ORF type:complete len:274 (+),score=43.67 TRINITY_DN5712_c0_g1_i2:280-1101(+)